MERTTIVVSRQWDNPSIKVFMNSVEIGAEVEVEVFLRTLVDIVGNPTLMVTKQQLLTKVLAAKDSIIMELKKATVHV